MALEVFEEYIELAQHALQQVMYAFVNVQMYALMDIMKAKPCSHIEHFANLTPVD